MVATGSAYAAIRAARLLRTTLRGGFRRRHRGKGQGELAAHEGDLALDHDHSVSQGAYVGLEPGEQSDLETGERQSSGNDRGFDFQRGAPSSSALCGRKRAFRNRRWARSGCNSTARYCGPGPYTLSVDLRHLRRRRRARRVIPDAVCAVAPRPSAPPRRGVAEHRPVLTRRGGHGRRIERVTPCPTPSAAPATRAAPAPSSAPIRPARTRSRPGPGGSRTRREGSPDPVRGAASRSPCPRS